MYNPRDIFRAVVALGIWGLLIIAAPPIARSSDMTNYCSTPPFLSNVVPPNVLIILDNSGSMSEDAYPGSYDPTQFVSGHYYGYFDPTQNYVYNGSRWVVTTADFSTATTANPIASGNLLNWATMERIEVAKKLLIGGKANPRSPSGGVTVKLDYETSGSFSNDFDNTAAPGLIAPFVGNYRYGRSGNSLNVTPLVGGTNTYATYPTGNISAPASWTVTGAASAWAAVDELVSDGNTTIIQNKTDKNPVIFDYNYTGPTSGSITQVTIKMVAKKSSSSQMKMQGVLQFSGASYASSTSTLSTSYSTYTWTWATNPATGAAWQWNDIKSSGVGSLTGFGVQAYTQPTSSNYPTVTQVYLQITTSTPSGGPYTLVVDQGLTQAEGLIDHLSAGARFGLAYYNFGCGVECGTAGGKNDGGHIDTYVDFGSPVNMITSIQNAAAQTWTPLAETVYEAIRYFRQDAPYYSNSPADYQVGQNYDPYYFQYSKLSGSGLPDQYVPCAKSFILLLTDGEATMDTNIPASLRDYDADGNDPAGTNSNSYATDYLDDVTLWGRTVDQRADLTGNQNVVFYTAFLFGKGSQLLKDAAINGGFKDLNGDGKPGPDLKEYLRDSNGDGVITASDLPLTYFEGDDGYELESSITQAIADILKRAASGTAVSVLTTSSRGIGSLVQAYFLPSKQEGTREVTWTGYTQNLWIDPQDNLREDTVQDDKLRLDQDNVLKLFFDQNSNETKAATFTTDVDGSGGSLAACSAPTIKPFSDVSYLWEAGKKLALKKPSARVLFTAKKVISRTTTLYNFSESPYPTFDTGMNATLKNELNPPDDNIIRYIRGECIETGVTGDTVCGATANTTYRDRRISVPASDGGDANGNVWKLGDIISSTPKVLATTALNTYNIDYADSSYYAYFTSPAYKQRSAIAFMGANDGIVHAFRVGYLQDTGLADPNAKALFQNSSTDTGVTLLGDEVWGYVPFNVLPYLKYLADPNYCHVYYNDLSVRLIDASVGGASSLPTDSRDVNSWRTILIGGMRFGGGCGGGSGSPAPPAPVAPTTSLNGFSAYFAIDITNPESPVPMWEFSSPQMGYASTFPAIVRTGDKNQNGNWYVVVGSGPTQLPKTGVDIARAYPGHVYFLNLKTGALANELTTNQNEIIGDILSVDADKDYSSEKIYFGTAYNSSGWKGRLVSVAIPNQDLSVGWTPTATYLFSDNYLFTASPDAAKDTDGTVWVYEGSGKYYSNLDVDASQQIFLGLKDNPAQISYPLPLAGMDNRTNTNTTGTVSGTTQACLYVAGSSPPTFSMQTIVTAITPTSATPTASAQGWYLSLPINATSQRVITKPLAVGGLVDFLTYQPSADPCSYGGNSFLYAVGYTTGVAPTNVAIVDPKATGGVTSGAVTVAKGVLLGPGAPPTGEAIIIPPPKEGEDQINKKIQVATGVIIEAKNNPVTPVISKVVHWLKK